ncbi:MAG TPA: hypothetical protein V6C46_02815 [Coleofasciculaceae cyanobacterium]
MATSLTGGPLTAGNPNKDKELNEFARIQGLSAAMQRWLRETFNVETVQNLADLSVNRVLSRLEDEGKTFSREQVEHWISQAQTFAAAQTSWQPFATFVVSLQSQQTGGQTQQRTIAYFVEADRRKIWSGIECNGVYELMLDQLKQVFQLEPEAVAANTPIAESQPAAQPSSDPDLGTELIEVAADLDQPGQLPASENQHASEKKPETSQLLKSSAGSPPRTSAEGTVGLVAEIEPQAQPEEMSEPVSLEIIQLKLWQPPEPEQSEPERNEAEPSEAEEPKTEKAIAIDRQRRSIGRPLQADAPLALEVTFQLIGKGAMALTKQPMPYYTEVYGQNRITGEKTFLGRAPIGYLVDGELTYTCRLANLVLPKSDAYRLQVITRLEQGHTRPDLFELPFIQVI